MRGLLHYPNNSVYSIITRSKKYMYQVKEYLTPERPVKLARARVECDVCGFSTIATPIKLKYTNYACRSCAPRKYPIGYGEGSKEHRAWLNLKDRCTNPNYAGYARYGGRGIRVSDKWIKDYGQFLKDVGPAPGKGYSIDRIDNDGDYEPGNVRWATHEQQGKNKTYVVTINYKGKEYTVKELSKITGLNPTTIRQRVDRGWTGAEIASVPAAKRSMEITHNGRTMNQTQWAKELGITQSALSARLRSGWSVERALKPNGGIEPR